MSSIIIEDEEYNESLYCEENYEDISKEESYSDDESFTIENCTHKNTVLLNDVKICNDCGVEIYNELSLEPEWRFYGENDNKHSSDPSRCYIRKNDEKNIYKDIEKYNFPISIIKETNTSYIRITNGKIRRGGNRKSIIFACVFNAYKNQNLPQESDDLRGRFGLTKKQASGGLTFYRQNQEEKSKPPIYISPVTFIPGILEKFNLNTVSNVCKITDLYNKIYNKSKVLNRSNPQSVISGLIYYYFKSLGMSITAQKFIKVVKLSEITVNKISKNISEILNTTDKIKLN